MCASGCAAIRLLLISRNLPVAAFCRGRVASKGDLRLSYTASVNHARRRAASRRVGVALLGSGVAPSFIAVDGLGVAWPTEWPSYIGVEPAMCLAGSNPGG